ncbi:hypothetical protein EDE12_10752 [Methylosinus sp. sav-2]|jgi:hypothetical protein|uniref:DUF2155 domain-containing protein n=1 Tax=unclassified Methylosinus TaxID=2624500 RepID=UPI000464FAAB|nr:MULTISPECIES: DUF2155 domain-containing protein [unclassified Methylosinus]TDX63414.1 hypothetical protein EDE12_10752 [Methylosinus sp. sav-2]
MISRCFRLRFALSGAAFLVGLGAAAADPIRNPTAIFAGLDKTTGRIINFDVAIDETVQFGSLQVTPRVCNTRPQTEAPQTTSFVEVDEQDTGKNDAKRIFSGWMFAASPGLHGVEHPVYDVWLVDCRGGKEIVQAPAADPAAAATAVPAPEKKRSRSRKVEPVAPVPVEAAPIGPRDSVPPEAAKAPESAEPAAAAPAEKPKKKKKKQPAQEPAPATAPSPFPF